MNRIVRFYCLWMTVFPIAASGSIFFRSFESLHKYEKESICAAIANARTNLNCKLLLVCPKVSDRDHIPEHILPFWLNHPDVEIQLVRVLGVLSEEQVRQTNFLAFVEEPKPCPACDPFTISSCGRDEEKPPYWPEFYQADEYVRLVFARQCETIGAPIPFFEICPSAMFLVDCSYSSLVKEEKGGASRDEKMAQMQDVRFPREKTRRNHIMLSEAELADIVWEALSDTPSPCRRLHFAKLQNEFPALFPESNENHPQTPLGRELQQRILNSYKGKIEETSSIKNAKGDPIETALGFLIYPDGTVVPGPNAVQCGFYDEEDEPETPFDEDDDEEWVFPEDSETLYPREPPFCPTNALPFLLFRPRNPHVGKLPLVMYFGGWGEMGTDLLQQFRQSAVFERLCDAEFQKRHPCILFAPMLQRRHVAVGNGPGDPSPAQQLVCDAMYAVIRSLGPGAVDTNRIYLTVAHADIFSSASILLPKRETSDP